MHPKMGLERFAIVLNSNPAGVYLPGQTVSGQVEIWNQYPKKFEGLQIYIQFNNLQLRSFN